MPAPVKKVVIVEDPLDYNISDQEFNDSDLESFLDDESKQKDASTTPSEDKAQKKKFRTNVDTNVFQVGVDLQNQNAFDLNQL